MHGQIATTEPTLNIHQRMALVMHDVSYVQKDQRKVANQYTAVKHDDVVRKVRGALLRHGVTMTCDVVSSNNERLEITKQGRNGGEYVAYSNRTSVRVAVAFVNIDDPKDCIVAHVDACGEDPGDKSYGKAISYAKKYAILTNLLLETGDDPDNEASEERRKRDDSGQGEPAPVNWTTTEQREEIRTAYHLASSSTSQEQAKACMAKVCGRAVATPAQIYESEAAAVVGALEDLAGVGGGA